MSYPTDNEFNSWYFYFASCVSPHIFAKQLSSIDSCGHMEQQSWIRLYYVSNTQTQHHHLNGHTHTFILKRKLHGSVRIPQFIRLLALGNQNYSKR